ncbi:hypothetical protein TWF694_000739 [Orbilia ellipsospora]|uniref:Uncharacterized protein n=1 Tax=Orbilia ellipsospora TaxID=2528407 RepID=A0AAV9XPJ5_9PEZI
MFPSTIVEAFDNRKLVPKKRTLESMEEEMQSRYQDAFNEDGGNTNRKKETLERVRMVKNVNFYNPPQYSGVEWVRMLLTRRPRPPPTQPYSYQFFNPYDGNEFDQDVDWRDIYPDTREADLIRWFPRYYFDSDDTASSEGTESYYENHYRMMDQYSQQLELQFGGVADDD